MLLIVYIFIFPFFLDWFCIYGPPSSNDEVKMNGAIPLLPLYSLHGVHRDTFTFTFV
jgi:hypothetical protein